MSDADEDEDYTEDPEDSENGAGDDLDGDDAPEFVEGSSTQAH